MSFPRSFGTFLARVSLQVHTHTDGVVNNCGISRETAVRYEKVCVCTVGQKKKN